MCEDNKWDEQNAKYICERFWDRGQRTNKLQMKSVCPRVLDIIFKSSFHPSAFSTTSVRSDSPILGRERSSAVVTKLATLVQSDTIMGDHIKYLVGLTV